MNVAIFSRENYRPPWNEGYKNMTRNFVKRLKNNGDNPIVISGDDIEKYRRLPAILYRFPLVKGVETIFILRRIIKQFNINLFFKFTAAFPFFGVRFYLLEKILGIPFYMYASSVSENRFGVKFLLNSKRLFVGGDYLKAIFPSSYLIYPLIDLDNFTLNNNRKINFDAQKVILFLGAFHKQRGVQNLIKAVAQLKDKSGIKLVLAWNGTGECEAEIRSLIRELDLEKVTEIRGSSNISDLYEEAHVVVIPRIYKKGLKQNMFFPLRIIEALVFQKPMIVSDIYEWGAIIKGVGIAVRPGNVEGLRDAINKMIMDENFYNSCVNECSSKLKQYHPDHSFSIMYKVFQNGAKR